MLESDFDWQALRESVNYLPSDSMAVLCSDDGQVLALFPVLIRESDGECFIKPYDSWEPVSEARFGNARFSRYEKIVVPQVLNTATLALEPL